MNKRLALIVSALGVGLLGLAFVVPASGLFTSSSPTVSPGAEAAWARSSPTSQQLKATTTPPPSTANQVWPCLSGGRWGMMDGWGDSDDWDDMGPGIMNGNRMGMMGTWGPMGNMGMMGSYSATTLPLSEADAQQRLATFAAGCGAGVQAVDVMAFGSNYYSRLVEGSGVGLGAVLVDRYSGTVYPEPGPNMLPNMMWNKRWGMYATASGAARYDQAAALALATTFLAGYLPGASVLAGQGFPGYYTFDFGRNQVEGMLSVNAATGEVWVHTRLGPALGTEQPSP